MDERGERRVGDARRVGERRYNIKELWDKHREIARQLVLGGTNVGIASVVGCTPQTVSNVRNSPIGQAELERLHGARDDETVNIAKRIEEFAPVALELLENIMTGKQPGASVALRAKVATGHLGRAGYGEVHKVHALHGYVTKDDLEEIKARALSAMFERVVDTQAS